MMMQAQLLGYWAEPVFFCSPVKKPSGKEIQKQPNSSYKWFPDLACLQSATLALEKLIQAMHIPGSGSHQTM